MGKFADLLPDIKGLTEEDRGVLTALAGKYPDLDGAVLRQAEFDRGFNQWKREKTDIEKARDEYDAKLKEWEAWKGAHWDDATNATREEAALRGQIAGLENRIHEFEQGLGVDGMTFEELEPRLKEKGYLTSEAMNGYAKVEDLNKKINDQGNSFEYIYRKTTPLLLRFSKDFGEDQAGSMFDNFVEHLTKDPQLVADVGKAYENFTAPNRLDLERKKFEDEKKAWEDQKLKAQEAGLQQPPTDTGEARPMGHLEAKRIAAAKGEEKKEEIKAPLGRNILASLGAEMYRKGEFSKKPAVTE